MVLMTKGNKTKQVKNHFLKERPLKIKIMHTREIVITITLIERKYRNLRNYVKIHTMTQFPTTISQLYNI